jgi:hypothetical protein
MKNKYPISMAIAMLLFIFMAAIPAMADSNITFSDLGLNTQTFEVYVLNTESGHYEKLAGEYNSTSSITIPDGAVYNIVLKPSAVDITKNPAIGIEWFMAALPMVFVAILFAGIIIAIIWILVRALGAK